MTRPLRIALVTCAKLPDLTADDRLALDALRARGAEVRPAVWDDPAIAWRDFDRIVLRSCWDYHYRHKQFLDWLSALESFGAPLWNPPALVRANADKAYLRRLQEGGVPVPATAWLPAGRPTDLRALLEERGWTEAVVKPSVSASAHRTWVTSIRTAVADQPQLDAQVADGDALVQEFASEIRSQGEWSFVFLGREYSHAILKTPARGDFRVQTEFGGATHALPPPVGLLGQVRGIAGRIEGDWLYARVDGIDRGGVFHLMELELIEPDLFLRERPSAPARFAEAILSAAHPPR